MVHIKNTSSMDIIEVSESYYDELKNRDDVEILSKPEDIKFDKDGFMI